MRHLRRTKKFAGLGWAVALMLAAAPAMAQSGPNFTTNGRPTQSGDPINLGQMLAAIAAKLDLSRLGQPNGVAGLDGTGKVPVGSLGGVQAGNLTWTVCATGCTFTSPADAWAAGRAFVAFGPYSSITINVADGTYNLTAPFFTEEPGTASIHFVGNVANASAVIFRFTNITGNNGSGFVALNGGRVGNSSVPGVNGVWLQGVGAQVDRQTWNSQSYGAGALSLGTGSNIHFGGAVRVSNFYYSVLADEGGRFVGEPGSLYQFAGDVNLLARHGGVIHCLSCTMQTASHILPGEGTFGYNIMAEAGGAVYADGSTGTDAQVACFAAQTSASMWAHNVEGSNCGAAGARVTQGAFAEFTGAKFHNSPLGIYVLSNGSASVDGAQLYSNQYEGLHLVGGQAYGNGLLSHDNGSYGIKLEKGARAELYGALAGSTNNASGPVFNETGAPCQTLNGACTPPSMLIVN